MIRENIAFCVTLGPGDGYYILMENFLYNYCNNIDDLTRSIDLYVHCSGENKEINPYFTTNIKDICKEISNKYDINIYCTYGLEFGLEGALNSFLKNVITERSDIDWVVFLDVDLFIISKYWFYNFDNIIQNTDASIFGEILISNFVDKENAFVATRFYTTFFGICLRSFYESKTTFNPIYKDKIKSDRIEFFSDVGTHVLFDFLKIGKIFYDIGPLDKYKDLFVHIGASGEKVRENSDLYDEKLLNNLKNIDFYKELKNNKRNIDYLFDYYNKNNDFFNKKLENWDILCQDVVEWMDFLDFIKNKNLKNLLTIGVNNGGGVYSMSRCISEYSKIINIDFDIGNFKNRKIRDRFFRNMVKPSQEIKSIDGYSEDFKVVDKLREFLNGEKIDIIFVDADHSYDGVKKDFDLYYPFLSNNGLMCFHDINTHLIDSLVSINLFWKEICDKFKTKEISCNEGNSLGIGIIFNDNIYKKPKEIELEVTSRCNLRCVQCSQSWTPDDQKKDIPDNILDAMRPALAECESISLHGIGEPLLADNFWEIIDAINPKANISFHSNMTIMNEEIAEKLTDGRVKLIDISMDAATEETYRKIRGASFDRVINNIKCLVKKKKEKKSEYPELRMNMTLMRENIEELPEFVQLSSDLDVNSVHVWRMNEDWYPKEVSNKFFTFIYEEQILSNHKDLFNSKVKESREISDHLGINFILDSPMYDEKL